MAKSFQMHVERRRLLPGSAAGLSGPTALVDVVMQGNVSGGSSRRISAGVATLCPEQPLVGVAASDWPAAFLSETVSDAEGRAELGSWLVALSIALQRWARNPVGRGLVLRSDPRRLSLALPWFGEQQFVDALELAVGLLEQWSQPVPDNAVLEELIGAFRDGLESAQARGLALHSFRFAQAALDRNIPVAAMPGFLQLGWGARAQRVDLTYTGDTGTIAAYTAQDKVKTYQTLAAGGIPVPEGNVASHIGDAEQLAADLGWPVVVKPLNLQLGIGVTPGITSLDMLRRAFEVVEQLTPGSVIVERHVEGDDYRMLVVRGKLTAVAHRIPGGVTGDGVSTVAQLVGRLNADPRRAIVSGTLKPLKLDNVAVELLTAQGLTVESVPERGRRVPLRRVANVAAGGDVEGPRVPVHPDNRLLAERAARLIGLDLAGVDLLTPDIGRSWREVGGVICEVNVQPALHLHWLVEPGRDLTGEIVAAMFDARPARIPTVAIVQATGGGDVALLLHHIWLMAGMLAGVCTPAVLRIGDENIESGDFTSHRRARLILTDPGVDAGIFEIASGDLNEFGHPCDRYDVSALLSISDQYCGVAERTRGAIVVNADDELCLAVGSRSGTDRHILVTGEAAGPPITDHRARGGEAVLIGECSGEPWIVLAVGESETPLMPVGEIATNVRDAMYAATVAWAQGIDTASIRLALEVSPGEQR